MAAIRIDSRNNAPGRDGSVGNPFRDFSELASPYRLAGGNDYELVRGSYWNLSACLLMPSLATLPITIKAVGPSSDPMPVIEQYRMCAASECIEVAIVQATDASGTASGSTTTAGPFSIGATTINLASAGTGTILTGGVVTFFGDITPYSVVSGDADVSTGGSITISPGLVVAISSAKAITLADTLTTPQAGTNIWRVPSRFFGLVGQNKWCAAKDISNSAGYGSTLMTGPYQCSYGPADGAYKLIWSVGNPVTTYGGLFIKTTSDADSASGQAYQNCAIGAWLPVGGFWVDGIEFGHMDYAIRLATANGNAANPLMRDSKVTNCVFKHMMRPVQLGSGQSPGVGYTGSRVTGNYGENLGSTFIDLSSAGGIRNDTLVERNVCNGFGQSVSVAGIYVGGGTHTDDGSRVLIQYNSLSGGISRNVWISDGYAFYQEAGDYTGPFYQATSDVEFRWNFSWNNDLNFISNKPGKNIVFRQNVMIAKPGVFPEHQNKFINLTFGATYGGTVASECTIVGNIGIGVMRFAFNFAGNSAKWTIRDNVCVSPGDQGGYTSAALTSNADGGDYTRTIVDGNNFIGFTKMWQDGASNFTGPPHILNAITSNPSVELASLPQPSPAIGSDPKVNYALMIPPSFWSGTVDLRYGTRLAA